MLKFHKILFFNTLILGTLISISSFSWLSMWVGLEINLLSIIPLINTKNSYSTESLMKYFITQTLASLIFIFSMIFLSLISNMIFKNIIILSLNSSLFMKMGAAPLHFWFPVVMEGLSWNLSLLMLTWQKIAPFILLSYNLVFSQFMILIIICSSMIGSISGLNQISLRKILTFSSINHLGWMISAISYSLNLWMFYFIVYSLISTNIIFLFKKLNSFYVKQLISKININKIMKFSFLLNFFSLGGLPPFLGFLPKWFTVQILLDQTLIILPLILIIFSLITLFFYVRISLSSLILLHSEFLTLHPKFNSLMLITMNFFNLASIYYATLIFNLN
uniref:NADH-ubiquinone oxidoreductase chain 2 n=1 Tax=Curculionoidea sp. 14 KM-2017 TaxID=2219397 RepID=A0A346RG32_9CUCU|nr:NADH dehydrogenase subunit 2 [Curculionoidea sp. 14 KM-2017]